MRRIPSTKYFVLKDNLAVLGSDDRWSECECVLTATHLCWRARGVAVPSSDEQCFRLDSVLHLGSTPTAVAEDSTRASDTAFCVTSSRDGQSVHFHAQSGGQRRRWLRKFAIPAVAGASSVSPPPRATPPPSPGQERRRRAEEEERASLELARRLSQHDAKAALRAALVSESLDVELARALQTSDRAAAAESAQRRSAAAADAEFARAVQAQEKAAGAAASAHRTSEAAETARRIAADDALRRRFAAMGVDDRRQLLRSIVGDCDLTSGSKSDVDLLVALHSPSGGGSGGDHSDAVVPGRLPAPRAVHAPLASSRSVASDELRTQAAAEAHRVWENIVRVCAATQTQVSS